MSRTTLVLLLLLLLAGIGAGLAIRSGRSRSASLDGVAEPVASRSRPSSVSAGEASASLADSREQAFEGLPVREWSRRIVSADLGERRRALEQLRGGGEKAVPVLAALFLDASADVRESAQDVVARIGPPAVPLMIRLARDEDLTARFHAVSVIGDLVPDDAGALEVLIERLDDVDERVISEAAWAVAAFRERAAPATRALVRLLDHEVPLIRIYAAGGLASIGPKARSAVTRLIDALADPDEGVRRCAAEALTSFGPHAVAAVAALASALRDHNVHVQVCAAGALGSIGPAAASAVADLRRSLGDPAVAHEAAWAIERITGDRVEVPATASSVHDVLTRADSPGPGQWPMFGRTADRNAVSPAKGLVDRWDIDTGENVLWSARLGDVTYGSPVVSAGAILVGTDNALRRNRSAVEECGVLLALNAADGALLWQDLAPDLGRGLREFLVPVTSSSPLVEGARLYYMTAQCQLRCLDVEGFRDDENDGVFTDEEHVGPIAADIIWELDVSADLGVFPHEAANCSVVSAGDLLMVCTSNGVDEAHTNVPAPRAPSFIGVEKTTGLVAWRAVGPGENILHGQWSSPAVARVSGKVQAFFGGGDGWLHALDAATGREVWRYDGNPKEAEWRPSGDIEGVLFRNSIVACPVYHEGLVYLAMGQDPEHGHGRGLVHAIDPRGRGDVTASRVVWKYEDVGRSITTPVIRDGLMYLGDYNGFVHCIDIETGERVWRHDLLAGVWGGLLVADGKVYVGDEEGTVTVFREGRRKEILATMSMDSAIHCSPVAVGAVIYIATSRMLWALGSR